MRISIVIFTFIIFASCVNEATVNSVVIKTFNDTILLNQEYEAELIVPYQDSVLPSFFITIDLDTFRVPFYEKRECGLFRTVGREYGNAIYKGFVEYINSEGDKIKEDFVIDFFVMDTIN